MQGAIVARAALCPKARRATSGCPAARARHVPRGLSGGGGGKWCVAAAAGERARDVPGVADARPVAEGRHAAGAPPRGARRGSVAGAVALIVGTSIGSGILAVPQRTAPAGFIPSAACMVTCWAFLVAEALLIAEINVHLRRRRNKDAGRGGGGGGGDLDLEVISVKSMAQETLGAWGGHLATAAYLFLSYTSMVAYASKAGEVLSRLIAGVPEPVSGTAFTAALALLVAGGGTGVTDRVNQLLTFVMIGKYSLLAISIAYSHRGVPCSQQINPDLSVCLSIATGLLLAIEVSAVAAGGGLSLPANANWEQVPAALPVIIFTLVFHDMAPVICAYLEGDLARIRLSILLGSLVPLVSLLVWDDIALGLATDLTGLDILDMLKTDWSYTVVETFSLLAVGTSLIGTLLGASQFFVEQLANLASSSSAQEHEKINKGIAVFRKEDGSGHPGVAAILEKNRLSYIATGIVVVPTMVIAATVPDSFSIATDIAGGYCMTILYGVLPPLMAWAIGSKLSGTSAGLADEELPKDGRGEWDMTGASAKPVLVGMGVFSVLMVLEQMVQDFLSFNAALIP
ncbi:tyrosine-specific transport protein-like [Panicum miliaceum]|uniref:Tyrosine-specific transport protein-like n=1 Tax=Panicum miliaceum TaxID=4540 RepID=A0A3L6TQR7_PANMI|nr:tyrosine-specific transport protein-like [Panicum miliaceum]